MEQGGRADSGPTMSCVRGRTTAQRQIVVFSMLFVNRSKRYIVAVWGDDFAFIVASEMLSHLTELLERNFECKLSGNIGPAMPQKGGETLEPATGLDREGLRVARGHETLQICPPEAWPRGGDEHERVESWEQDVRHKHPRQRGLPQRAGDEGICQCCRNLALPRFGPAGLAVRGGRLMSAVTKPQRKHLAMMKHCLRYTLDDVAVHGCSIIKSGPTSW